MANSQSKRKKRSDKFPLTLHPTGQYCKKIRGKLYYFGRDKQQAFQRYIEQAANLYAGAAPSSQEADSSTYLKDVCNLYLEHQHSRVQAGEIRLRQVYDQTTLLRDFVQYIGTNRKISEISTIDLQNYRSRLIKQGKSAARVNNYISAFKAMFHWAVENQLVNKVPNLSAVKKLPQSKAPKPVFTPGEIRHLLDHANLKMRAMIWLGLNCGLGCTDCAELLWEDLDLDAARINFPRPKTGVARYLPLWKETVEVLKALPRTNKRVFNTKQGHKVVRFVERRDSKGLAKLVKCDNVSREFAELTKRTGTRKGKGAGFYTLRRTAATLAARSGDPFAVQRLLGHADLKMATTYVQDVSEQTDRVINNSRKFIVQDDS